MNFAGYVKSCLANNISQMPAQFYDTFDYTKTGHNLTHSLTLGILAVEISRHPQVAHVGVDVHLEKFYPDIVAFDCHMNPILLIDYESPNSSDMRVIKKDVDKYLVWTKLSKSKAPYIIITTLPDKPSSKWELRWTNNKKKEYNYQFRGRRDEIRENPFQFWYSIYRNNIGQKNIKGITFFNINGRRVDTKCL